MLKCHLLKKSSQCIAPFSHAKKQNQSEIAWVVQYEIPKSLTRGFPPLSSWRRRSSVVDNVACSDSLYTNRQYRTL